MCQVRQITVEVRLRNLVPICCDLRELMLRQLFFGEVLTDAPEDWASICVTDEYDDIEVSVTLGPRGTVGPPEKIIARKRQEKE